MAATCDRYEPELSVADQSPGQQGHVVVTLFGPRPMPGQVVLDAR